MTPRWLAALGLVLAMGLARSAGAQTATSLSWSRLPGAESCIGAAELARRIDERRGRPLLVAPSRAQQSAEGTVGRDPHGTGWRAVVALAGPEGAILSERTVDTRDPSCRALDDALVLIITLLADPDGKPEKPPPVPERVVVREIVREVRVREPWRLGVRTGLEIELGALPDPAPATSLAILVDPPDVPPIEVGGFLSAGGHEETPLAARGARLTLAGVAARLCPARTVRRLQLGACGGVRLAWLGWQGQGFETSMSGTIVVPSIGLDARAELRLVGPVHGFVAVGGHVALRYATFTYQPAPAAGGGAEPLFTAAPASVWMGTGLAVHFSR